MEDGADSSSGFGGGLRRTKPRFDGYVSDESSFVSTEEGLVFRSEESGVFSQDGGRSSETLTSMHRSPSEPHLGRTRTASLSRTGSLTRSTGTKTVCRICEQGISSAVLKQHSKVCAMINKGEADIEGTDELLLAGMTSAERRVCALESKSNFIMQRLQKKETKALKELIAIAKRALSLDDAKDVAREKLDLLRALESLPLSTADAIDMRHKVRTAISKKADYILELRSLRTANADVLVQSARASVMPTINDFSLLKTISRGAFGQVYLARKRRTGDYYAIKVLSKEEMVRRNQVEHVKNERMALAAINSPFVIRLYYCFQTVNYVHIVMEYASGGDIFSLLDQVTCMDQAWARFYTAELVLALEHIHSLGIVHRDIKPENLLISKDGHIKLADFGLCKIITKVSDRNCAIEPEAEVSDPSAHDSQLSVLQQLRKKFKVGGMEKGAGAKKGAGRKTTSREKLAERRSSYREHTSRSAMYSDVGTTDYMAPEVILGYRHGPSVDWWALGVCLFEFLVGVPPFYEPNPLETFSNIVDRNIEWPEELSADAVDLIDRLLTTDVSARLGSNTQLGQMSDVRAHPFFAGTAWDGLSRMHAAFIPSVRSLDDTQNFRSTDRSERAERGERNSRTETQSSESAGSDSHVTGHSHSPTARSPNPLDVDALADSGEKSQLTEAEKRMHADPENFGMFTFKNWNFLDDVNQHLGDSTAATLPETSIAGQPTRKASAQEHESLWQSDSTIVEEESEPLPTASPRDLTASKEARARMLAGSQGSSGSIGIAAALSSMGIGRKPGFAESSDEDEDDEDSLPLAARLGLSLQVGEPATAAANAAPAEDLPTPRGARMERGDSQAEVEGIRCLVAEDNPVTQRIVQALMRQMGIAVDQAFDGRQAVDMAAKKRYDVIFMDMMMPVMCGDEAAAQIRSTINPNTESPIIAFTAMDEDRKAFKKQGFTDLLCKPITRPELYQTLQKYVPNIIARM
eukprot:Opistho-1_new@4830